MSKKKAMLFETKSMNKNKDDVKSSRKGPQKEDGEAGGSVNAEEEDSGKENDQDGEGSSGNEEEMEDSKEWLKINKIMSTNMARAIAQLNRNPEDEEERSSDSNEESYSKKDMSIQTGDHDLSAGDYDPDAN